MPASRRYRRGDGNSYSTAYSRNYIGQDNIPAGVYFDPYSDYWYREAHVAKLMVGLAMRNEAEFNAWKETIPEEITQFDLYQLSIAKYHEVMDAQKRSIGSSGPLAAGSEA